MKNTFPPLRVGSSKFGAEMGRRNVMFQHHPRWYFGFEGYDGDKDLSTLKGGK